MRAAERDAVNTAGHPPIVVCGEILWPDGGLPECDRLSYDDARWAFFLWDHWGGNLRRLMGPKESNSFGRQRLSAFTGLMCRPNLRATQQFLMRCVRAYEANPDGESRCQLVDRTI